jgi:hypothetical protein
VISADQRRAAERDEHPGRFLATAISEGRLDLANDCFSRGACLLTPDATVVRGRENIRPILAQLLARETRIEILDEAGIDAGSVQLAGQRWRITSRGVEGEPFSQVTHPVLVTGQIEQRWKLLIAAPWGWAAWSP